MAERRRKISNHQPFSVYSMERRRKDSRVRTVADMNAINSVSTKAEEESKDDEEEEEFIKYGAVDEFYELGKEIGRGSYGTVKKCIHKERRNVYAVKMIKTSNHAVRKNVLREIEVMRALGTHNKLVLLHDAYQTPFEISMVLEFVPGGELFERIVAEEYLMEDDAIDYVTQILEALEFMHEKDIVHLDLKPENILCVSMDNHDIKLVDFGLARDLNSVEEVKSSFGTPDFVAPEVIRMKPVSRASDLWSLGVVTYVLLSGLMPFSGDDDHQTLVKVAKADWDFDDDCFDDLSDDAKEFIEGLLVKEPSKRLTIDECFRHPWIKDTKDTVTKIHTQKHRAFMAKRRWKKSVNALLAVRRMSLSPLFSRNRRSSMDPSLLKSATEADEEPQSPERKGSSPLSAPGLNAPGRCTRRSCFDLDMETIKTLQKKAEKACGKETHKDDCECKEDGAENERLGDVTVNCSTELENDGETEEPSTPRRRASTVSGATSCKERKTSQISIAIGDAAPKRDFEPVCFTFDTNELQQNDKLVLESNTAKPAQAKRKNATNGSPKSTRDSSRFTNDTASTTIQAQQAANCVLKPQKFTWQLDQSQGGNNDGLEGLKSDSVERIPTICVNDELCPTNPSSISVTLNNNIEKMDQKEMGAGSLQTTSGSLQTSTSGLSMATVNLIPDGVQSITVKLDDFNNGLQFPAKQVSCHVPRASTGSPVNLVGSSFVRIARP